MSVLLRSIRTISITKMTETADDLCSRASKKLEELCIFHDTFFHLEKQLKQDRIAEMVQEIENIVEKVAEASSDSKYNAKIAYVLGKAKNCGDNYSAEAEMYLRRAVKLDIHDVNGWNTLAECLWKKTEYVGAKECLLTSVATRPNIEAYCLLSMLVKLMLSPAAVAAKVQGGGATKIGLYTEMIEESVRFAKAAIALDIGDSKSWYILGNAWCSRFFSLSLEIQDLHKSLACYNKAIGLLHPSEAAEGAAAVSVFSGASGSARNRLPNPDLYYNKAVLCFYVQDYAGAVESYERANSLDPGLNPQIPAIVRYVRSYEGSLRAFLPAKEGDVGGFPLNKKKKAEFISQVEAGIRQHTLARGPADGPEPLPAEDVGFSSLRAGTCTGVSIVLKLLVAVNPLRRGRAGGSSGASASGSGSSAEEYVHTHPESTYLCLDCRGQFGFVSVFHIGSDVSLCDHHASSSVLLTVSAPTVRSTDGLTIIQVFDVSTCRANGKMIAARKIAANKLNTRTFDS
jgi:tetratricopeptide (TPR) repeat protein